MAEDVGDGWKECKRSTLPVWDKEVSNNCIMNEEGVKWAVPIGTQVPGWLLEVGVSRFAL